MLALEIHQLSWMTITLLRQNHRQMFCHLLFKTLSFFYNRYYFLVHLRSNESVSTIPPSRLRRLSLSLVWALLPPHLLLSFAATVPRLRARGWHQRNSILHMPSSDRLTILFSAQAVVNLPGTTGIIEKFLDSKQKMTSGRWIHNLKVVDLSLFSFS